MKVNIYAEEIPNTTKHFLLYSTTDGKK